jgi:hypothetical protein
LFQYDTLSSKLKFKNNDNILNLKNYK